MAKNNETVTAPKKPRKPRSDGGDLQAEIARLKAENESLKKAQERAITLKVSEKGGLSLYGLGRFPVTLYREQWERLLDMGPTIMAFIQDNAAKLKTKGDGK